MDAKYIGAYNSEGGIESYPAVDLAGQKFEYPPTITGIGGGRFVVLPTSGNWTAEIEAARKSGELKALEVQAPDVPNDAPAGNPATGVIQRNRKPTPPTQDEAEVKE